MKITTKTTANKRVDAIINAEGTGIYLRDKANHVYLLEDGILDLRPGAKWEVMTNQSTTSRVMVHEGEEITITF